MAATLKVCAVAVPVEYVPVLLVIVDACLRRRPAATGCPVALAVKRHRRIRLVLITTNAWKLKRYKQTDLLEYSAGGQRKHA